MAKGCAQCLRVFVILINTIFLVIGLAILAGALFLYFDPTSRNIKASTGLQMEADIVLFVAMGIGAITALAATFGCCGAFHETDCLLATFCTFVILVCLAEIGGGVFLYLKRTDPVVPATIHYSLKYAIRNANETSLPEHIRFTQQWLRCCGANGTEDYRKSVADVVCVAPDGERFTEGCAPKLYHFIETNALWALIGILSIAVIELLCMIFAASLCCSLRRERAGYIGVSAD